MPTVKLTPTAYTLSNTNYLSISNADNMYDDVDSTTYSTTTHNRASSSSTYYLYIRGFDADSIPSNAIVTDYAVRIKASGTGLSTSSSYRMSLYYSSTAIANTTVTSSLSTTVTTFTFPTDTLEWETLKGYIDDNSFRIRVPLRRASSGTAASVNVYGAEIEVTYTVPNPRTVTSTLTGDGTISPSGAYATYEGEEYELTITPTNKSDTVTATQDGVDITSQLVAHGAGSSLTIVPDDVTTSKVQSGSSYAEYAVSHSAESPSSSGTSSNMYASSGSTGYATYSFDFSGIPSNATIEEVEVRCYGHRENATIDSTHVSNVAVYVGSTNKADEDFPTTSNSIVTLNPTLTRSELDNAVVRHTVGYYGGLVLGISFDVTYSTGTGIDHYTYTYTVSGDSTIAVVIGAVASNSILFKDNGSWVSATKVYKKVSGAWVQQTDLTTVFVSGTNYVRGD